MGEISFEKGMEIDKDRVRSLSELKTPKNKVEKQRIIGSFNYVRRYIINMTNFIKHFCE